MSIEHGVVLLSQWHGHKLVPACNDSVSINRCLLVILAYSVRVFSARRLYKSIHMGRDQYRSSSIQSTQHSTRVDIRSTCPSCELAIHLRVPLHITMQTCRLGSLFLLPLLTCVDNRGPICSHGSRIPVSKCVCEHQTMFKIDAHIKD